MISVIVPVYNVEPYLKKCLDSIIGQSYKDLEILIIDDGSTDYSGNICDEYEELDDRIRVFHTENKGLSCARNLGLDEAKGEWIGFVDSDDWIEPNMYEALLNKAEETGADVVECGFYRDYPMKPIKQTVNEKVVTGSDVLKALLNGQISTQVWDKIYRAVIFNTIRFPVGRSFEDIATTHKMLVNTKVAGVSNNSYHWIQRESGLSQSHDLKNLKDYWLAYKGRYDDLNGIVSEEEKKILLKGCAYAIARAWVWYWKSEKDPDFVKELSNFTRNNYPLSGHKSWLSSLKISILLARFNSPLSFITAYAINQLYRFMKPKYYK